MKDAPDHPAKFTPSVLREIDEVLRAEHRRLGRPDEILVLDPFAGVGGIHDLDMAAVDGYAHTVGLELEREWAEQHPKTMVGDALDSGFETCHFHAVATSPCYGNRMADHHEAKDDSSRITYRHKLGRMPSTGSAAVMQWGDKYRTFHKAWITEAMRVVDVDSLIIVNMKNHLRTIERGGSKVEVEQLVIEWWTNVLILAGNRIEQIRQVQTPGMGFGANGDKRTEFEVVIVVRTPSERVLL